MLGIRELPAPENVYYQGTAGGAELIASRMRIVIRRVFLLARRIPQSPARVPWT